MKTVRILIQAVRTGERVSSVVRIERRRGNAWTQEREYTAMSGDKSADRTLLLQDDQRLIIEGQAAVEMVMDPAQFCATEVTKLPTEADFEALKKLEKQRQAEDALIEERPIVPAVPAPLKALQLATSLTSEQLEKLTSRPKMAPPQAQPGAGGLRVSKPGDEAP